MPAAKELQKHHEYDGRKQEQLCTAWGGKGGGGSSDDLRSLGSGAGAAVVSWGGKKEDMAAEGTELCSDARGCLGALCSVESELEEIQSTGKVLQG